MGLWCAALRLGQVTTRSLALLIASTSATAAAQPESPATSASASAPSSVELHGDLAVTGTTGLDTNATRDFTSPGVASTPDAFTALSASLSGSLDTRRFHLIGGWDGGGRKFIFYPSEDTEVQSGYLNAAVDLSQSLSFGVDGSAKDRRGAERDYSDLLGEGFLDFSPDWQLDARLHAGAHRFIYWDQFGYSFATFNAGANIRYRFDKHHGLTLFGEFEPRRFNAQANADPSVMNPPPLGRRKDTFFRVGLGYQYRGPFQLGIDYEYADSTSNSFGESYSHHRISVRGAVRLPAGFTFIGAGALQFSQYPDGVYLSPQLLVLEDDENLSSFSLKLSHPIGDHWDLELKEAFYFGRLPHNDLTYIRDVVSLGVTLHL